MNEQKQLPIFPLGVVMLPGVTLPLHIFEERYKRLIQACIASDSNFGIVYYNGSSLIRCGCTVSVERVLHAYPDGRLDILVRGHDRFFVSELVGDREVLEARVGFFGDEEDFTKRPVPEILAEVFEKYLRFRHLQGRQADTSRFEKLSPAEVSFALSAEDFMSTEERRENLEGVSLRCRFERIITALDRHIERLSCTKIIQKMIGENGDNLNFFN